VYIRLYIYKEGLALLTTEVWHSGDAAVYIITMYTFLHETVNGHKLHFWNSVQACGTLNGGGLYPVFYSEATERPYTNELVVSCGGLSVFSLLIFIRLSSTLKSDVVTAQ
jgi:hypothetical protein